MDSNEIILVVDAVFYLATLVYWHRRKGWRNVGVFVWLIMTISHVGAIFYYRILSMFGDVIEINAMSLAYLYVSILISLYPYLKNDGIKKLEIGANERLIKLLSWFVIIMSIEPLLENIYILFHSSNVDYGEIYEDRFNGEMRIYSFIGEKLNRWVGHFRFFITVSFFYFCTQRGNRRLKLGLGLVLINFLIAGVNKSSRGDIVCMLFLYTCCILLMYSLFEKEILRKIRKTALALLIPSIAYFMVITTARFDYSQSSGNKTLMGWLLLYCSEGPNKFSNEMWEGEHNTNGDVNLCFLKDMIGLKTYTTYHERDEHYLAKNGRRVEVFYTFVGDFVSDFGIWGGFIVTIGLSLLSLFLYKRDKAMSFSHFIPLLILINLYSIGFASNVFRAYGLQKCAFINLLIAVLLSVNQACKSIYSNNKTKRMYYDIGSNDDL